MDKALKQRLVGASVLIILAVIVLPMLLSGRSDTLKQESRQIELPPKPEELSIETRRFPVGVSDKASKTTRQESISPDADEDQNQVPIVDNSQVIAGTANPGPVVEAESGPDMNAVSIAETEAMQSNESAGSESVVSNNTVVKPPDVTSITLKSGRPQNLEVTDTAGQSRDTPRYLVQVGSFSSEKNAIVLSERLRNDKFPVLMDVVDRVAGRLYRVRVGPYAERSEADAVVASLRSKMSELSPRVLDLRPSDSSPVSTPSDPLVRWVVQVGSFNNSGSAEALVAELRLSGLAAFSEKVTSADGTVFKVRIGPELDRSKAADLARKVKAEHNLDGFVTTQE